MTSLTSEQAQRLAVVKVGGDVLEDEAERAGLAANVRALVDAGYRVVVLHGGGPQVNRLQEKVGLEPRKVAGRRVTSLEDLVVVEQAICGEVNVGLVSTLLSAGVNAFGCHGASGKLVVAVRRPPKVVSGGGDLPVDFGEVGDVERVDGALIEGLLGLGVVPVIATLGVDENGRVYNINADTTAVAIARALRPDVLLLVTGVGGIFRDLADPSSRIDEVSESEARALIASGVIAGGMIPKVEEAMSLFSDGIDVIAIAGAADPGAFLAVASGGGKVGTRIVRN